MAEIVLVFKKISPASITMLSDDLNVAEIESGRSPVDILKCSALVGQFNLSKFVRIEVLASLASNLDKISETGVLMAAMSILNHSHLWLFKDLTSQATEHSFKTYV